MIVAARTHQGNVRLSNQDSLLVREGVYPLYAVADGMGGHRGGNVASAMAVAALERIDLSIMPNMNDLLAAFQNANKEIWEHQLHDVSLSGMGTTLTALWESKNEVYIAHVGDSRAYSFYEGQLSQLTLDHSLVGELLRSGAITAEMAKNYPYRNIVTRAVGTDVTVQVDLVKANKHTGVRYLICSDGLTEYVTADVLSHAFTMPLDTAADYLLKLALNAGGRDNISIILLEALT